VRVLGQQRDREGEQVVELERVRAPQLLLARAPDGADQPSGRVRRRALEAVGRQQQVLGARDLSEHLGARRLTVIPECALDLYALGVRQQPVDHAAHVGLVVDRVAIGAPEHAGVLAQQPRTDRVKRRGDHATCDGLAEQIGEPEPQLARGADAERDRQDLRRPRPARR
jgi:hypothetical protein